MKPSLGRIVHVRPYRDSVGESEWWAGMVVAVDTTHPMTGAPADFRVRVSDPNGIMGDMIKALSFNDENKTWRWPPKLPRVGE